MKPLWKGHEILTKVAKFGHFHAPLCFVKPRDHVYAHQRVSAALLHTRAWQTPRWQFGSLIHSFWEPRNGKQHMLGYIHAGIYSTTRACISNSIHFSVVYDHFSTSQLQQRFSLTTFEAGALMDKDIPWFNIVVITLLCLISILPE